MALTLDQILEGSFSLIFIVISFIMAIKLLLKYKQFKNSDFIYAATAWILLVGPWFNSGFNFLYVLITGVSFSDEFYFLIAFIWPPIAMLFWMKLFTSLIYPNKLKLILVIFFIQAIVYEIFLIYFIFTDLAVVGEKTGIFDIHLSLPFLLYILALLIIGLITGIIFGREPIISKDPILKYKGYFIILAWFSFFIGALLDAGLFPLTAITLVIVRLILISSAIEFYFGFFLPKWIKH